METERKKKKKRNAFVVETEYRVVVARGQGIGTNGELLMKR